MKIVPDSIKTVFVRKKIELWPPREIVFGKWQKITQFQHKMVEKNSGSQKKSVKLSQNGFLMPKWITEKIDTRKLSATKNEFYTATMCLYNYYYYN